MTVHRALAAQLEKVAPRPERVSAAALQAEIDHGQVLSIVAEYPGSDETTLIYCVRSARRALDLVQRLRLLGLRPVAYLGACDVPSPPCCPTTRLVELVP